MLRAILRFKPLKDLRITSIVLSVLVLCLLTIGILYYLTLLHRHRAYALLRDVSELKLGTSTLEDAQRLAKLYGGIPWYVNSSDMTCTFQKCRLAFQLDNMPLSYIPGVGYTRFGALLDIESGVVVGREIDYERATRAGQTFRYLVFDSEKTPPKGWNYGVWRLQVDPTDQRGIPHTLEVRLGPASTAELRERAYSIDLSCLAKLYRCSSPADIYPSAITYLGPPFQGLVPDEE